MAEINWERRRRNVRILIAAGGTNATQLAKEVGLSPNTLTKFTNGATDSLSEKTLALILPKLGLSSSIDLDTDNPIDNPKVLLRQLIDDLPESQARQVLSELKALLSK